MIRITAIKLPGSKTEFSNIIEVEEGKFDILFRPPTFLNFKKHLSRSCEIFHWKFEKNSSLIVGIANAIIISLTSHQLVDSLVISKFPIKNFESDYSIKTSL